MIIHVNLMSDLDNVVTYMNQGQKLSAIKELRAVTLLGLREAKDVCDDLKLPVGGPMTLVDSLRKLGDVVVDGVHHPVDTVNPLRQYPYVNKYDAPQSTPQSNDWQRDVKVLLQGIHTKMEAQVKEQHETNQLLRDMIEAMTE